MAVSWSDEALAIIHALLEFGGLLGHAPIIAVSRLNSAPFIARGGRIPAPLQGLRN